MVIIIGDKLFIEGFFRTRFDREVYIILALGAFLNLSSDLHFAIYLVDDLHLFDSGCVDYAFTQLLFSARLDWVSTAGQIFSRTFNHSCYS